MIRIFAVKQNFARELRVWARLGHPNVLSLLGYAKDENYYIVSERMEKGSLRQYLDKTESTPTMPADRLFTMVPAF